MPLVFVHGVNVRRGQTTQEITAYNDEVKARDDLFRKISLADIVTSDVSLHIENPYWGDDGVTFTHDLASVPVATTEVFGSTSSGNNLLRVLTETVPLEIAQKVIDREDTLLLTLAREYGLAEAIDTLIAGVLVEGRGQNSDNTVDVAKRMLDYAGTTPTPEWLTASNVRTGRPLLRSDRDLIETLFNQVNLSAPNRIETFGGGKVLEQLQTTGRQLSVIAKRALKTVIGAGMGTLIGGAVAGWVPSTMVRAIRPAGTQRVGIFLGDVFTYLNNRGTQERPGPVVAKVVHALDVATEQAKSTTDTKIVVVAHSMGGNIMYDILTYFRPDLHVDLWVTVGSQVALFQEMRLYKIDHQKPATTNRVSKPANVKTWLNVFDPLDVLSFAAEGVFENVHDYAFSNQSNILNAHTLYFVRPQFHQRLASRVNEFGLGA